ncbi:MAG: rod shape-determining protein RodA [Christensenellales bacterium]
MQRYNEKKFANMDWLLLVAVAFLCLFGLVAIANATASPYSPDGSTGIAGILSRLNLYYVRLQLIWIVTGTALAAMTAYFDYRLYQRFAVYLYLFGLALLVIVLFMPAGRGGVKNSIPITANFGIQPGELVKLAYIVMMAKLFADRDAPIKNVKEIVPFIVITAVPIALVVLQKEIGTALTYIAIFAVMMFLSGTGWKLLMGMGLAAGVASVPAWFVLSEYMQNRILNFLDPTRDLENSGYNVLYAKTAAGSGQIWGKGLFQEGNLSQLDYVPEKHTDFIFSVTAEAVGLVGSLLIVAVFIFVLFRILRIARTSRDAFGTMVCIGVMAMFFFHIFENICMNIGLMPVTGIPLPFLSYGGSAMWANLMGIGMCLSVALRRKSGFFK